MTDGTTNFEGVVAVDALLVCATEMSWPAVSASPLQASIIAAPTSW